MENRAAPFQFMMASYVVRIDHEKAWTLNQLRKGLDHASDASIFFHTFQSLGRHHFLTEGFSSDVAQWVLAGLNRPRLAELLGAVDVRDYLSLAELRADLSGLVARYCDDNPRESDILAFEPFHFCEAAEITLPLGEPAHTVEELRMGIERLSHASLYYHLLVSRLRLHLKTNDFSQWLEALGKDDLARRINRIDIYTNTLDGAKDKIVRILGGSR